MRIGGVLYLYEVVLPLRLYPVPCCAAGNGLIVLCDEGVVLGGALPLLLLLLLLLRLERGKCKAGSRAAGGLTCSKETTSALQGQPCCASR